MARPKTYIIKLSDDERAALQKTIRNKKTCKTVLKRCQILLEPLGGVRHVSVREHRTAVDWAEEIRYLVDVSYPDRDKIILVICCLNSSCYWHSSIRLSLQQLWVYLKLQFWSCAYQ